MKCSELVWDASRLNHEGLISLVRVPVEQWYLLLAPLSSSIMLKGENGKYE